MMFFAQINQPTFQFTIAPLFEDYGIPLALMGILVVFMALALIVAFITLLPRLLPSARVREDATMESRAGEQGFSDGELSEEMLVVISAAVAVAMDRPHRVVRIRGVLPTDFEWSLEGRIQQHHSHTIQHRARR